MKKAKYKKGQQVVYNGLIGVIVGITKNMDGAIMYDLEAQLDCKLSCTALESLCEWVPCPRGSCEAKVAGTETTIPFHRHRTI